MLVKPNFTQKKQKEGLSTSTEDYLEEIYFLEQNNRVVRVRDISKALKVSMPSVHQALHVLKKQRLIKHENYGYIELTQEGKKVGEGIYRRHQMLIKFLTKILNIPKTIAAKDACQMEHDISSETMERLIAFLRYTETYPHTGDPDWLKGFRDFYNAGK